MITYNYIDTPSLPLDRPLVARWLDLVAASYDYRIGNINYIFCSDEHILEVNRQYLQHDYYTDVITFDYTEQQVLNGDIFISVDTVRSNAEQFGTDFAQELTRIIIHGVLHLTGQADKTPETKVEMTRKEDLAIQQLTTLGKNFIFY